MKNVKTLEIVERERERERATFLNKIAHINIALKFRELNRVNFENKGLCYIRKLLYLLI